MGFIKLSICPSVWIETQMQEFQHREGLLNTMSNVRKTWYYCYTCQSNKPKNTEKQITHLSKNLRKSESLNAESQQRRPNRQRRGSSRLEHREREKAMNTSMADKKLSENNDGRTKS